MAVVPRKTKKGIVYWVCTSWPGGRDYERAGYDRRDADRLDKRRRREVKAGTFVPVMQSGAMTFGAYAARWLEQRTNRSAPNDRQRVRDYVLTREWCVARRLEDWRISDSIRLVNELQHEAGLSQKTVCNTWQVVSTMLRDAMIAELIPRAVTTLPRETLKSPPQHPRSPYTPEEAQRLISDPDVPLNHRVLWALLFCTGMREGEACGLRWKDYDPNPKPFGSLNVERQYEGGPLKTDKPRVVPVHPALASLLEYWKHEGWELLTCSPPTAEDPIVPSDTPQSRTKHCTRRGVYRVWRRTLDLLGIENRSLHSTRNTMITIARRNGADEFWLERVTHNAKGTILDQYTAKQWEPLCEAVARLPFTDPLVDARVDAQAQVPEIITAAPGRGPCWRRVAGRNVRELGRKQRRWLRPIPSRISKPGAVFDARQQRLDRFDLLGAAVAVLARRAA